ncbi:MAG: NUDIX hydrolase [Spirochaetaceae bacterium]
MYKPVKATVGAIVESNGKILLERRSIEPFAGMWCIPGGHIEFGEPVEDAMKREVREETGLEVTRFRFLNYYTEYFADLEWHAVALVFVCSVDGSQAAQEEEVSELAWFTPARALELELAFEHRQVIRDFADATETGAGATETGAGGSDPDVR